MIILDTNVISALMQQAPVRPVVAWLDRQAAESVWVTSVTVIEARYGIAIARRGRLATRNVRDFSDLDVDVVNPWEAARRAEP
jgi:predicted nucleic acid-binding protein